MLQLYCISPIESRFLHIIFKISFFFYWFLKWEKIKMKHLNIGKISSSGQKPENTKIQKFLRKWGRLGSYVVHILEECIMRVTQKHTIHFITEAHFPLFSMNIAYNEYFSMQHTNEIYNEMWIPVLKTGNIYIFTQNVFNCYLNLTVKCIIP